MNYKKIGLLLVAVSVLLNGYFLKDYLFKSNDKEVRVQFVDCLDANELIIVTFIEKDKKVFTKLQDVKDGKVGEVTEIIELDDCVIIDNQNWTCGGKTKVRADFEYTTHQYTLNNGKFSYTAPLVRNERLECNNQFTQLD
jgi:hypothetical protein